MIKPVCWGEISKPDDGMRMMETPTAKEAALEGTMEIADTGRPER